MSQDVQIEVVNAGSSIANAILKHGGDPATMRLYEAEDGQTYFDKTTGFARNAEGKKVPTFQPVRVANANATLRKDEWIELDTAVTDVFRKNLTVVNDLRSAGLVRRVGNGMGKTVFESQAVSDMSDAIQSMDGLSKSDNDRVEYNLTGVPMYITSFDFQISARELAASRNDGAGLDTVQAQIAARKVADKIEGAFCGSSSYGSFGGYTSYGLANYPNALTKSDFTAPTATAWTQQLHLEEIRAAVQQLRDQQSYGPFMAYYSSEWDQYLNQFEVNTTVNQSTLKENIERHSSISMVKVADFLPANKIVLVEMKPEIIRAIEGMDVTTLQWQSHGGMLENFKVMSIIVPQIRGDFEGKQGLLIGSY